MRRLLPVLVSLAVTAISMPAAAATPEELLQQLRQQQAETTRLQQERETRFQKARDAAAAAAAGPQRELRGIEAQAAALRARYEQNSRRLLQLQQQLQLHAGDTSDIPSVLRQGAASLETALAASLVNAQAPARAGFLAQLGDPGHVAGAQDLQQLGQYLLQQLRESGRIVRFTPQQGEFRGEVLRVGEFAAVTEGAFAARFLAWLPERGLVPAARQPDWSLRRAAQRYADSGAGVAPMVLDPAAGGLLRQLAQQPNLWGRAGALLLVLLGLMLSGAQLLRGWRERDARRHARPLPPAAGPWQRALAAYDERFWVATAVSGLHLFLLLWLLVGLFGFQFAPPAVAQNEEVFEIVPLAEGSPGDPGPSGGAPQPPALPPPPAPSPTSISMPKLAVATSEVAVPTLKVPAVSVNASSMFGSKFGGFAGSGGGTGGGAGYGAGGYGGGRGGGGKPLIPLSTARPQIPEYAYRRGIEGWVVVSFTVSRSGNVRDVRIVDAEPKGVFEAAAVESIANWIYPRMEQDSQVTQRVEFKLEDFQYNWN